MDAHLPAVGLVASPGKRAAILDLAREIETRGFAGIACPSLGGSLALCTSLAHATNTIRFWTSIQPIYLSHAAEVGATASHISELSDGRFSLGIGVSHASFLGSVGVNPGKPLGDTRAFVETVRKVAPATPIILATLRDRMLALSAEIGDGAVWANAARSATAAQLDRVPAVSRDGFFLGNMVPTVIDSDRRAARDVHRKTLVRYIQLPNYRNYWKVSGYEAEMTAIEAAIAAGERDRLPGLMTDAWIDDCTLSGSASEVRDGVEAWRDAGITTPILVMSSTSGGQAKAINELFAAFAS